MLLCGFVVGLEFSDFELGVLTVSGALLYWVVSKVAMMDYIRNFLIIYYQGMMVFKLFLFDSGWRNIYLFTSVVNFVFSIGQVRTSPWTSSFFYLWHLHSFSGGFDIAV